MSGHAVAAHAAGQGAPLRLGISGFSLRFPQTGTGRYALRVLEHIARAVDLDPALIVDGSPGRLVAEPGIPPGVRVVRAPDERVRFGRYGHKLYWEQIGLRLAARRLGIDVLYSPHFSLPLFAGLPTVLSIHDVIPLIDPAYTSAPSQRLYFWLVSQVARQATAINTLSEHARGEIERLLDIPRLRINVIPPGVEAGFSSKPDPAALARARDRLALPDRYLLYVGGADARKNIGVLLRAIGRLRDAGRLQADIVPPLVIAAPVPQPAPSAHHPDWRGMAAGLDLGGAVRFVERIAEEDLAAVYRGALAFLFPSRSEGFGLTPLEAMACGTPVLSSDATSLPEAVGSAGILLPPDDDGAWAEAIARVCRDEGPRHALREAGLERAARFRWEHTGEQVISVIREAARCGS